MNKKYIYIIIATIPLFIMAIGLWALVQSPYTGLHFEQKNNAWYIKSIDTYSPAGKYPELKGKEVISIAGWNIRQDDLYKEPDNIKSWVGLQQYWDSQRYFEQNIHIGNQFELAVKDGSTVYSIAIIPSYYDFRANWLDLLFRFIAGISFLIIALLIVIKKIDPVSKLFYITSILVSILNITTIFLNFRDIASSTLLIQSTSVILSLSNITGTVALFNLMIVFPRDTMGLTANKWLLPSLYISSFIIFLLFVFRIFHSSYYIFVLTGIIAGLYVIYRQYQNINPVEKAQMRWIFFGLTLFLIPDLFFYLLPPLISGHRLLAEKDIMLLSMIFPLSIAFAIMKYKLMDIDTLFDNTLIYSVTIGLLAMIDVVIVYVLTSNKIPLLVFKDPFPTIIAVWVIIFAYLPVRNKVRDVVKRILKREMYDLNDVSTSYSQNLISAYSTDDVMKMARDVIERTLHPKNININILDNPQKFSPVINTETGEAVIPLTVTTGAIGLIVVGEKHSGRLYDRDDVRLLNTIANQTALAIESIRHREGMRLKEEESRAEKERISKEIHDGIGSSLVQAKLLIDMAKKDPQKLSEASGIIDNGIKEMRELVWVVEQDEQTLGDLIYHIENRMEQVKNVLNIVMESKLEDEDTVLSPEQKLNLSRIVQESMTNIIKHADASRVDISFVEKDKYLEIIISDNGKGFDVGKAAKESYGLRNMRARAERIGARLDISSESGRGSVVRLAIRL